MILFLLITVLISSFFSDKYRKFFLLYQCSVFLLIAVTNIDNADYSNYELTYESINDGGIYLQYFENFEIGYKYLAEISNYFNLSFFWYRFLIYFIGVFTLFYKLKNIQHSTKIFVFYVLFSGIMDIVQMRNFIASIFIFQAYFVLYQNRNRLELLNIKILLNLILASLFQKIGLIYLSIYLLLLLFRYNKFKILFLILILLSGLVNLLYDFFVSLNYENIILAFEYIETRTSFILYLIVTVILLYTLINLDLKKIFKPENNFKIYMFTAPIILCVILVYFNVEFIRIYRNLTIIYLIVIFNNNKILKSYIHSFFVVIPFSYLFLIIAGYEIVLLPIIFPDLSQNILFGF